MLIEHKYAPLSITCSCLFRPLLIIVKIVVITNCKNTIKYVTALLWIPLRLLRLLRYQQSNLTLFHTVVGHSNNNHDVNHHHHP